MFIIFIIFGLLIVFTALCIICDEHLIPTVEVFIKQFNVPEEVAAVTLVAFGSAAPEIMLNTVGAAEHDSSLSLPSVLGSAMIAFGLIPATSLLFSQHRALQIEVWPLLRETGFYLVGLFLFLKVIADSVTETIEALFTTLVYFIYVTTVVGAHLYSLHKARRNFDEGNRNLKQTGIELQQNQNQNQNQFDNLSKNQEQINSQDSNFKENYQVDIEGGHESFNVNSINVNLFPKDIYDHFDDEEAVKMHRNEFKDEDPLSSRPLLSTSSSSSSSSSSSAAAAAAAAAAHSSMLELESSSHSFDRVNVKPSTVSSNPPPSSSSPTVKNISIEEELNSAWLFLSYPIRTFFTCVIPKLRPDDVTSSSSSSSSYETAERTLHHQQPRKTSPSMPTSDLQSSLVIDSITNSCSTASPGAISDGELTSDNDESAFLNSRENDGWSPAVPLSLSSSSHQDSSSFDRIRNRKSDLDKSQSKENLTSVINTIEKNVPIPEYLSGPSSHVSEELLSTSPPSLAQDVPLLRAILILCLSIACIGILASFIILLCTELAKSIGVDQSTIGATLVSLGAEIPDTISAISLSRNGFMHGAISGAIGSQVINISLGVGLPALLLCLAGNGKIKLAKEDTMSLDLLVCLVFIVLGSFILVTIPVRRIIMTRQIPKYSHLNRYGAFLLLIVWFTSFMAFIVLNSPSK